MADWTGFEELMTGQEAPHFRFYWGLVDLLSGDADRAIAALEPAFDVHPGDLYGRLCQALLAIARGHSDDAQVILSQLAEQRTRQGGLDGEVTFEIGHLLVMSGSEEKGVEQLALAVDQGFYCADCLENDPVLSSLRGVEEFDAVVAAARQRQRQFVERFGLP